MPDPTTATDSSSEQDSLYGDGEEKGEAPESIDEEEREQMAETALVPMKMLRSPNGGDVKQGDVCRMKVMAIHGDEAELAWEDQGGKGSGKKNDYMSESNDELDSMSEKG